MARPDEERLYETRYMQVYSYAMTLTKNGYEAEEIAQETFVRAFSAKKDSSGAEYAARSSETTWLCAIAKNIFLDGKRREKFRGEMPEDVVSGDDVEEKLEREDLTFRIHRILHTLEEPYKEVFELRVFGELPFAKIGAIFGKTENWARVTYHRANLKIKERMDRNE